MADALAALGARLVLVGRDRDRLAAVRDDLIAAHGVDRFPIVVADMASLASVRAAADAAPRHRAASRRPDRQRRRDLPRTDRSAQTASSHFRDAGRRAVRLVAGCCRCSTDARRPGRRGHVGRAVRPGRSTSTTSSRASGVYDGTRAYARAKRAQVALMREWARRLGRHGIRFNSMHPGWADTPGLAAALPRFLG